MLIAFDLADPERALAVAYAPAALRPALALLWRLDERLGGIVAGTRETMIGEIRLAWWREALEALDGAQPPAEPLLRDIAAELLPRGISGSDIAAIEAGWAVLLDGDPPDEAAIRSHGHLRGRPLFSIAARLLTGQDSAEAGIAGEGWSLADLGSRLSSPLEAARARELALARLHAIRDYRWPVALRPLGMLAILAARDAAMPPGPRRQGSPARVGRALLHRITGR